MQSRIEGGMGLSLINELLAHEGEDRLLLLSGGPQSHLARTSMLCVGMTKRLVLTQPAVQAQQQHSPLSGETILEREALPMQGTVQSLSQEGWKAVRIVQARNLAEMLRLLANDTPSGSRWAGALAYDLVQWTQPIRLQNPPDAGSVLGVLWLVEDWQEAPAGEIDSGDLAPTISVEGEVSSHTDAEHAAGVRKVKDAITAGELYQLNLGRTWSAPLADDPCTIFRRLTRTNPAPFSGFMEVADLGLSLVSCSPEILVDMDGSTVMTAPIKGTKPRGSDADQESMLRRDLVYDAKERAEHRMLVDLERNDLGIVCKTGTVRQSRFDVEAYANVQHLVSQVTGELDEDKDGMDVLQALFPGGSITGCPKTVTCAAIDEIEGKPRSFWTGSMGWIDPHTGEGTWNIMIRTLEANWTPDGWHGTVMAGGGITIESNPDAEVAEAIWKAAALRRACGWLKADTKPLASGDLGIYPLYLEHKVEEDLPQFDLRVAFIDNLDSLSHNIIHALRSMGCKVDVIDGRGPITAIDHDAVVIGPGPGRPEISPLTMKLANGTQIPTLGICLGHQALGLVDGMELVPSPFGPVHGMPTTIIADGTGLLAKGVHSMTRYNSLILTGDSNDFQVSATDETGTLPMEIHSGNTYGVQFHPESIGSQGGMKLLAEFLQRVAHC